MLIFEIYSELKNGDFSFRYTNKKYKSIAILNTQWRTIIISFRNEHNLSKSQYSGLYIYIHKYISRYSTEVLFRERA